MGGIAGAIDLTGHRLLPAEVLQAMADALQHRGPDEEGFFQKDAVSLASRRLRIVGLFDGQQPTSNEDHTVSVVYNGELFDYREQRKELEARGHRFATSCDTEILPHAWEEYGEGMFERLRGQFAFALWDNRQRRLILARDRFGICPLYWSRRGDWLLFASEIKALLASGLVPVRADLRGINHAFTFFATPGPVTAFEGVSLLQPGHYLDIKPAANKGSPVIHDRTYWEIDFPDQGQEEKERNPLVLVNQFEELLLHAVEKRLRADVPVTAYQSGGVDSSIVVAMANKLRGQPISTFTIRIDDPALDESSDVSLVARHIGSMPSVVHCGATEILNTYPRLVKAAETPVLVTSCAAMLLLAERVHQDGYKVALTGEAADEWLGGYPWYRMDKLLSYFDFIPGLPLSQKIRRGYLWLSGSPPFSRELIRRTQQTVGGHNGWLDIYGMMSMSKLLFFSERMRQVMQENDPYADLQLNQDRLRRWHPFNRSLYLAGRVQLPGLLLSAKNDRVAMHSSVETRFPFLDEKVFTFLARLHPRWKMRGLQDKYLLRLLAERWLPREIVHRRKTVFRAPSNSLHISNPPPFVHRLLSKDALRKTGYFDPETVTHWRQEFAKMSKRSAHRQSVDMGLAGVLSTQLWHHLYLDSTLCELPGVPLVRQACSA